MKETLERFGRLGGRAWFLYFEQRYLHDFVFIHINKNAGSSIEKALGLALEHNTALEKIRHLGRRRWDGKFTFAIVRNPWDRAVSQYHYRVEANRTSLGTNPVGFTEWVKLTYGEQNPRFWDDPKMFLPQLDWITDHGGAVLVNYVGRFELLDEAFGAICDRLRRRIVLPHERRSKHGHYRTYYDPEAARVIGQWFRKDIEAFRYEF